MTEINNIFTVKKLLAVVALTGMLFVSLHPLQHAAEIAINIHDSGHVEIPFSSDESDTNELDCIDCVLSVSLIYDFDLNESSYSPPVDLLNFSQFRSLVQANFEVGFSLRAPPILFG